MLLRIRRAEPLAGFEEELVDHDIRRHLVVVDRRGVIERRIAGRNLTRTLIDASQVAAVIAFLASPLSVSINGESIACGGGTPGVIRY